MSIASDARLAKAEQSIKDLQQQVKDLAERLTPVQAVGTPVKRGRPPKSLQHG